MKIPALLHLTRLGYEYLPRQEKKRDRESNILPDTLRKTVERINGMTLEEETFQRLMSDLLEMLNREDLGESFYRTIRNGWNGLKLLDYTCPRENRFQAGTEISCRQGRHRFRPDLTVFVNGLPLAMMEVKIPEQQGGILAEYDRTRRRFQEGSFRRFLQCAQIWLFSNGRSRDEGAILPRDGAYYTTGSSGEFAVYPGPDSGKGFLNRIPRLNRETERMILEDLGMPALRKEPDYRKWTAPDTPTHRMMTALLTPERFLFLIRYGIQYMTEEDGTGRSVSRKRILTPDELDALRLTERKLQRGFRNWTIPCRSTGNRIPLSAAMIPFLKDRIPGCRICWVTGRASDSERVKEEFRRLGIPSGEIQMTAAEMPLKRGKASGKGKALSGDTARNIYILSRPGTQYRTGRAPGAVLRSSDPEAILITLGEEETREGGSYTYLLRCSDGSLYCGWTNDLEKRVRAHNEGKGARYTRTRRPVELVYWESHGGKAEAMSREWHIKHMTRAEKERLIRDGGKAEQP